MLGSKLDKNKTATTAQSRVTVPERKKVTKSPEHSGKDGDFDVVRRHICQALGFDYVFVDIVRGDAIVNLISFAAEDEDEYSRTFVDTLIDEHQQPLTLTINPDSQKVVETQSPFVSTAFATKGKKKTSAAKNIEDEGGETDELSGCPYAIVPIINPGGGAYEVRGLLRVLSFDTSRTITEQDISTLKLMGEHLSTRMTQFGADQSQTAEQEKSTFENEHILITHANRLLRRRYSRALSNNYQILEADSGDRAAEILKNNRIDLIILDSDVKGSSGESFCKVLKESQESKHLPVLLISSDTSTVQRVEGLNAGADDCIYDTCSDLELAARVKSSLRHRKAERELSIQLQLLEDYALRLEQATEHLSVDKQMQLKRNRELKLLRWESDILRTQDALLHRISNTIRQSFNITENLHTMLEDLSGWFSLGNCFVVLPSDEDPEDTIRAEYFSEDEYQLIVHDTDLRTFEVYQHHFESEQIVIINDAERDRRLETFRKNALPNYHFFSLFFVPITYEQKLLGLLGGYKTETQANWNRDNEAFLKSVADQVATGVTNARLYARVQRQATTDGLTGLFNHRTGQEKLAEQLRLAERYERNLSVVMLDVDHFKSINDNYGHPAGDTVLKAMSKLVRSQCRDVDLPVRYGGEEFLLVLPEVNQESAVVVAERIRTKLAQETIHHEQIVISVTASFGIASFPDDAHSQQALLDLADKSLYLSKRLGRNQVHTAGDLMFEEISPSKPKTADEKAAPEPSDQHLLARAATYADFVANPLSPIHEQKEELVPEVVEMVKALATALYSKSDYNKQHHLETARLSELLAKVMGLSQQQVEQIRVAGLLHDVGTLAIPVEIMNRQGAFNIDEREIMNQHPALGSQLLKPIRALRDICQILENHHERWDGAGFPSGLKGEDIPLAARIVGIVDSYHAMISDRPYRPAMDREEAIQTLRDGAGTQWDPYLIDIFIAVLNSLHENKTPAQLAQQIAAAQRAHQDRLPQPNQNSLEPSGDPQSRPNLVFQGPPPKGVQPIQNLMPKVPSQLAQPAPASPTTTPKSQPLSPFQQKPAQPDQSGTTSEAGPVSIQPVRSTKQHSEPTPSLNRDQLNALHSLIESDTTLPINSEQLKAVGERADRLTEPNREE